MAVSSARTHHGPGGRHTACSSVHVPAAAPPPSGSSQTVVIQVSGAGTITVRHTPTAITQVDVTTTGGYTYEIEDRTGHEVKVEFEGGGPKIEVEVHLEDGEITYQIDGDGSAD